MKNVKTNDPEKIIKNKKFNALKKRLEADITNNKGRINVRKSGTEKLLRIMVESNDSAKTKNVSEELESFAKNLS